MTRGQRRRLFTRLLPRLIDEMYREGFEAALSEGYVGDSIDKPGEDSPHTRTGGHFEGTAVDVNLYQCQHTPAHAVGGCPNPVWLTSTAAHARFGHFWKSLHPLCNWGGDFPGNNDGNHYGLAEVPHAPVSLWAAVSSEQKRQIFGGGAFPPEG